MLVRIDQEVPSLRSRLAASNPDVEETRIVTLPATVSPSDGAVPKVGAVCFAPFAVTSVMGKKPSKRIAMSMKAVAPPRFVIKLRTTRL
jgi:hypothetical protein